MRSQSIVAVCVGVLLTGCYIHTHATSLERGVRRSPTCSEAVSLFQAANEVNRPYVRVAQIWVWQPADMAPTALGEQQAERKKAAEFGANGLILGHRLNETERGTGQKAIAIFIPEDSAHAMEICQSRK